MYRKTYLEVNLKALESNFLFLKKRLGNRWCCPMVKANAYGHGAIEVVRTLMKLGQKVFGVALIEEAIELREAGLEDIEILIFAPVVSICAVDKYRLTPVVTRKEDIPILEQTKRTHLDVHLKVNMGLNRLGVEPSEVMECVHRLKSSKKINLVALCSHLSHGIGSLLSKESISKLIKISKKLDLPIHVLKSASFLSLKASKYNYASLGVRLGISLYGVEFTSSNVLKPVMSLKSQIIQCHHVGKGEGVSYGWTWRAQRPSLIGVVPIGYADGLSRNLSNKAFVSVDNLRVPQVGTICMDYLMVDLTEIFVDSKEAIGKIVNIFGDQGPSVRDWANWSGTISYEILSRMGLRIPRTYVESL